MILFLTNADTEILAMRSMVEALPADFPPVRAGNPANLAEAPSLLVVRHIRSFLYFCGH